MRIPIQQEDGTRFLTPEELARRERENDVIRPIWDEKHRPEKIVVPHLSAVPAGYQHWVSKGETHVSR